MKTQTYNTPATRAEFERKMHLLGETLKAGRFHVAPKVGTDGLARVRYLPNGRIDLLSIDESTRLTANTLDHFKNFPPDKDE